MAVHSNGIFRYGISNVHLAILQVCCSHSGDIKLHVRGEIAYPQPTMYSETCIKRTPLGPSLVSA